MPKHRPPVAGYGIILCSAVLFGTYGVWSHLMGATFAPFYQAWVRSLLIILMMLPFMFATKSFKKIERKDWPAAAFFIAFCVCTQVPLYYAFNHAPIATVQLIFYSAFVIAAYVVGKVYLAESITKIKLLAMALAFVGLIIVFGSAAFAFAPLGLALALFNGVASGGETSSTKRLSDTYPPMLLAFWGWVATFLLHLPLSLIIGEKQVMPAFEQHWLWLVVYAVVNMAAFWLVIVGYRVVDASIASLVGLTEVLWAILFGAVVFHQSLTWSVAIGGILILFAAMLPDLLNIVQHKHPKEAVEPVREL